MNTNDEYFIKFQGSLSDLKGRKPILLITLVMSSIAYVLIGVTDSIILILMFRAYLGKFFFILILNIKKAVSTIVKCLTILNLLNGFACTLKLKYLDRRHIKNDTLGDL